MTDEARHNIRTYEAPGPVARAFLNDRTNDVRTIMGPIGSGKTNLLIADGLDQAMNMPVCKDGVIRFRDLWLRSTYNDLWATTIRTWNDKWFSKDAGEWHGSEGRAVTHILTFQQPGGVILRYEMWFRALQDISVEEALRGIEFTRLVGNEFDLLSSDVLTYGLGRVKQKRYPSKDLLPPEAIIVNEEGEPEANYYAGVCGDLNPPDIDSWIYEHFEENPPAGHVLYKQPSGRGPEGENRIAISRRQYEDLAADNAGKPWWVRRFVDGQFGYSRDGEPVYPEFDDDRHVAEDLKPLPDLGIRLSFDQGVRGPAMVVTQLTPVGQLRVLGEYVPEHRMGPTQFAKGCVAYLFVNFRGFKIVAATCDPAGFAGGDKEFGDLAWSDTVAEQMKILLLPAPSNELNARLDGVRQLLTYFPDQKPALLLSSKCKVIRKGFMSHYRYKVKGEGKQKTIDPKPEKNLWSNPHDALQYDILDAFGLDGVIAGAPGGEAPVIGEPWHDDEDDHQDRQPDHNFDVFEC
ncbi:MAG: hypothetical protein OER56_02995 [Hyphomicrobiales bacterium]|nr:hypothetical protein [Hyphomicrobiales bacterium]